MEIKGKDYLLYCNVANIALLDALFNSDLNNSDFYKNLQWSWGNDSKNTKIIKEVLDQAGYGNGAMMIMQFYALLMMPKQLTPDYNDFCEPDFNKVCNDIQENTRTTYKTDKVSTNYYRHIRNALAHSSFEFQNEENVSYILFKDINSKTGEVFETKFTYHNAAFLLDHLCGKMMQYLNNNSESS